MIRAVISDLGKVVLWFDNDIFIRKLGARCGLSVEQDQGGRSLEHGTHHGLRQGRDLPGRVL